MSQENVEKLIKDNKVEFVDLRFVDMRGVQQHVTFPISIGPGSVSVILTLMASVSMKDGWAKGLLSYAIIALVIVLMCLILYLFLSQGERIIRKIGTSGSIVINKMVAFFTFCVGVQIVVTGIAKLFHLHL